MIRRLAALLRRPAEPEPDYSLPDPRLFHKPEPFPPHRFCLPPPDFGLVSYYSSFLGVTGPMSEEKEQQERIRHIRRWEAENGISIHEAENRFQAWGCWHRDQP